MTHKKKLKIYTDGACKGNPGLGGWGALIIDNSEEITIYGGKQDTTNNEMEITAAIKALEFISEASDIDIFTDSKYVMDGITDWIKKWKVNSWKTAKKKPVKHSNLWIKLDELNNFHATKWHWVKGHSNHRENDIADRLANLGIEELF